MRSWSETKRLICLCLMLALAACGGDDKTNGDSSSTGGSNGEASAPKDGLGIAAAKVIYKHDGGATGTVTLWFQDYGKTWVLYTDLQRGRMEERTKITRRDGMTTQHDYVEDKTQTYKIESKISELDPYPPEQLRKGGYKQLGEETILGNACEHWKSDLNGHEIWVYKGFVLKEQMPSDRGGWSLKREATSFTTFDEIPAAVFEVP